MMSDGGLTSVENFSGLKSIISGPAGGVVGMALTSWDEETKTAVIGLDMGGTSVSALASVSVMRCWLRVFCLAD